MRSLVVVPTYNEADSLRAVLDRALAADPDLEILVVDDASPDGTGQIADEVARREPRVSVLHRRAKAGLGSAYRDGFARGLAAGYDVFVEMDADLSHDPADLPRLIAAAASADLVIGSRYVPGGRVENWPPHRRALSAGGNLYVRAVTGVHVRDATSGFRAFRRALVEDLDLPSLRSEGYSFQLETVIRAWNGGWHIQEVPITFVERRTGASKISRAIILEALWRVLGWGVRSRFGRGAPHRRSAAATARTDDRGVG